MDVQGGGEVEHAEARYLDAMQTFDNSTAVSQVVWLSRQCNVVMQYVAVHNRCLQ